MITNNGPNFFFTISNTRITQYQHFHHPMKVTTEAQLGLIGGTMGLLTGFSILSAVEIIYYLIRLLFQSNISVTLSFTPDSSCL